MLCIDDLRLSARAPSHARSNDDGGATVWVSGAFAGHGGGVLGGTSYGVVDGKSREDFAGGRSRRRVVVVSASCVLSEGSDRGQGRGGDGERGVFFSNVRSRVSERVRVMSFCW